MPARGPAYRFYLQEGDDQDPARTHYYEELYSLQENTSLQQERLNIDKNFKKKMYAKEPERLIYCT